MKVIIVYGSGSDQDYLQPGRDYLDREGIPYDEVVLSAHRNLPQLLEFLDEREQYGEKTVYIAVAGLAAALPGIMAVSTKYPVIGVPVAGGPLQGIDALLSITQLPGEVPAVSVGLHKKAPLNACIFAHRLLRLAS